jgi:[protein-PII] uridylyltransferase
MDVEAAQAYTRIATNEAVDFFWLRRLDSPGHAESPVLQADASRIAEVLCALCSGARTLDEVAAAARAERVGPAGATRVRFDETTESGLAVLTVETFDRPGLLLAVTRALHRARVQILASEATTTKGHVVDRFTLVELDGAPLRPSRRGMLQVEVLAAVDSLGR